jgi:hypothetical protein
MLMIISDLTPFLQIIVPGFAAAGSRADLVGAAEYKANITRASNRLQNKEF